ncbi:hypothetical protein JCM10599A_28110 [Paraburkholderia kururiensis]
MRQTARGRVPGALRVDSRLCHFAASGFGKSMSRPFLILLFLSALTGCADNSSAVRHGPPPQDPPDYHGVPTDVRPPQMIEAPEAAPK